MIPKKPDAIPDQYKIQEGGAFWGIANNLASISVNDLIVANPDVDPKKLKIGQMINLAKTKHSYKKPNQSKKRQSSYKYPLPNGNGQVTIKKSERSRFQYADKR
ncbi:LysM domain-containing protein [Paraliobacillus sp. JSM ZJ581]|uniref:LysM peptidoglycan-binding domain-containing protein n=1 Tax=Paraliobacillus sp. JSM ZJ581 TaxID=3342118 RepID=UPI0035A9193F